MRHALQKQQMLLQRHSIFLRGAHRPCPLPESLCNPPMAASQLQQDWLLQPQQSCRNGIPAAFSRRALSVTATSMCGSKRNATRNTDSRTSSSTSDFSPNCHLRLLDEEALQLFPSAVPLACTELPARANCSSKHDNTSSSNGEHETWYMILHGILGGRRNLRSLAANIICGNTETTAQSSTSCSHQRGAPRGRQRAFCFDLRGHGCSGRGELKLHLMARDVYAQIYLLLTELAKKRRVDIGSLLAETGSGANSKNGSNSGVLLPHWPGIMRVHALSKALGVRLVLVGHSFGGMVCMQSALDTLGLPVFAAVVVLDIAPSPYLLQPHLLSPEVASRESTSIFIPFDTNSSTKSSSSKRSTSSESGNSSSRIACCLDVARLVPPPKEGGYSSAALISILADISLPLFSTKAAVAKVLQQLQPPINPAVINWLLLSLSTNKQRTAELEHLTRQQTCVSDGARIKQGVVMPHEMQRQQDMQQLQQHLVEKQFDDALCWHLDLLALQELVATNISMGLAAAPLSVHNPELTAAPGTATATGTSATGSRPSYTGPCLFVRGALSPWLNYKQQQPSIHRHFPKATLREVTHAGHWLHAQQPQQTAATIMQFLRALGLQ